MNNTNHFFGKPSMIILIFVMLFTFCMPMCAQEAPIYPEPIIVGNVQITGLPDDWTHHRLVFSDPGIEEDAIHNGNYDQWLIIVNDPRYIIQQLKRGLPAQGPAGDIVTRIAETNQIDAASTADNKPGQQKSKVAKDWSMDLGTGTVGAGQYPAKYSFSTTATGLCSNSSTPDYVVYNTGKAGASGSQANIIAYDNIYSGCSSVTGASTTVPLVYWSYYTGTGTAATSPVLSLNGTMVAFIESGDPSSSSTLRILKWKSGEGTNYSVPAAPDETYTNTTAGASGNTAWSTCPSGDSCLISIAFQANAHTDTLSAPYYDYPSDTLWVGDSSGYLHEFTGVFLGTPGEVTSGGWPVSRSSCGGALASPVYDNTHSLVFVGDFCGDLDAITTSGGVTSSSEVGYGSPDIDEAPLVDPTAGKVYLFVTDDGSSNCSFHTCTGVFQFAYNFGSGSSGSKVLRVAHPAHTRRGEDANSSTPTKIRPVS